MIEIRPANQKDIEEYYGGKPVYSMKGIVVLEDGKPIGVGGIFWYEGKRVMFSEMKVEAAKYKRAIIRAAKDVIKQFDGKVVYAIAENCTTSPRFLKHLGFELVNEKEKLYRRA